MGLELKNCPGCGRVYVDTGLGMCRDCYEKELQQEDIVASYVRDNPRSAVKQICDATGVKERVVMRMIKAGRFISGNIAYPCESCGALITRGRLCEKCNHDLLKQVEEQKVIKAAQNVRTPGRGMYSKDMGLPGSGDKP